jgi:hypothetical protein
VQGVQGPVGATGATGATGAQGPAGGIGTVTYVMRTISVATSPGAPVLMVGAACPSGQAIGYAYQETANHEWGETAQSYPSDGSGTIDVSNPQNWTVSAWIGASGTVKLYTMCVG